jgi:hypothetical protein
LELLVMNHSTPGWEFLFWLLELVPIQEDHSTPE